MSIVANGSRLVLFLALTWLPAKGLGQASFEGLGDLEGGDFGSVAIAVSADGTVVVGQCVSDLGPEAFRWESGTMVGLGDLDGGSFSSQAKGVSADGLVVVGQGNSDWGGEAFRWEGGVMTGIGDVSGGNFGSYANDVSANGFVVVGTGASAWGAEAFRWESGIMTGLGALNDDLFTSRAEAVSADGAVVVGYSVASPGHYQAFRWQDGAMTGLGDPPGGGQSYAYDVSTDGSVIVGRCESYDVHQEAFRWEGGTFIGLGDLPGGSFSSRATAVSADGSVIVGWGAVDDPSSAYRAFIWREASAAHEMRSLKDVLENDYGLDLTGWTLTKANDVSADGLTIVGEGIDPSGDAEGWVARIMPTRLVASDPPMDGTLPKTAYNVIRLTFEARISFPDYGYPLHIIRLRDQVEATSVFTYSLDAYGTTLIAEELDAYLGDQTWWRITPVHDLNVAPFTLDVCTLIGDANNSGRVTTSDYSDVKAHLGEYTDGRPDLNASGRVTTADYSVVKAHLGNRAPTKP